MEIRSNFKIILLFGIFLISSVICSPVLAQIPPEGGASVKITTPYDSAKVPSGELTIYGTSSDDDTKNCQVFVDWNDLKPMQIVTPQGPKGNEDYSKWSYTYTSGYHNIVEGSNELTSKITCYDQAQNEISKSYSINVTGKNEGSETNNTVQQSDVNTDTSKEDANSLPVQNINNNTANNTSKQSDENTSTDKESNNSLPEQNVKSSGTYKILPLYSESNEKVKNSASSKDSDKSDVTSTQASESLHSDKTNLKPLTTQQEQNSGETTAVDTSKFHSSEGTVEVTNPDTSKSHSSEGTVEVLHRDTNNLPADQKISGSQNRPSSNNPDSDSLLNHNNEGSSVFGLKMKASNEDTKTEPDNKIQKLQEKIADKMQPFGLVG
ncbi:MAG TPA: hypothetical protein VJM74_04335 [Nitrososphaeraceae archaeon]|nr:hypothetical protein [Nitrososphaeraceae archaeon]